MLQQGERYLIHFVYQGEQKDLRQHKTTIIAVSRLLKILLVILATLIGMQALHIDITGIVAIGGAGTIVLGIAAQQLLANFFGGMMIFMDEQFMVGDSIKAPGHNIDGVVEYIGWRLTRIRTADKSLLYVPNSVFLIIGVENSSRRYNYQIKETIRLKYQDVQKINVVVEDLLSMIRNHPGIDTTQISFVGINKFNSMTADCLLWCFTKATDVENYLKTQHDVLCKTDQILVKHGLEIGIRPSSVAALEN
jgi:MscS family membrane protein